MGPPAPGATWAVGGAPWPIWAKGTSPKRPMRQEKRERKSPKGGRHLLGALGGRDSSLGRRPPRRLDLLGPAPPLGLPIYSGEREDFSPFAFGASLSLSNTFSSSIVLGEALPEYCSSTTTTPSCCCWSPLPQPLPPPCWIKARATSSLRTCLERGGAVRSALGSSVIRITSSTTPSTPFS